MGISRPRVTLGSTPSTPSAGTWRARAGGTRPVGIVVINPGNPLVPDQLDTRTVSLDPATTVFVDLVAGPSAGTTFLQEVWKKQPKPVRFLLGGSVDQQTIVTCVLGANQYLEKPLDTAKLQRGGVMIGTGPRSRTT